MSNEQTNEQTQSGLAEAVSQATTPAQETSETNPPTPPAATPAGEEAGPTTDTQKPEKHGHSIETMEDALKVIADLRAENAKSRTTAKEQAAEQARTDLIEKLAASLGLSTTPSEEEVSPEEKVSQFATEVEQERARAKTAALELAVYRAATNAGVNADMLLDSRSFADAITDLDPGDTQAISDAINNVVQSRPELRQVQATSPTRTDHTPGGQDSAQPTNVSDAVASYYR